MRHDRNRKLERNRALVKYRNDHPDQSWAEVGAEFHVSRQRAQEIDTLTRSADAKRT